MAESVITLHHSIQQPMPENVESANTIIDYTMVHGCHHGNLLMYQYIYIILVITHNTAASF